MDLIRIVGKFDNIDEAEACVRNIKHNVSGVQEIRIQTKPHDRVEYGDDAIYNEDIVRAYIPMNLGGAGASGMSTAGIAAPVYYINQGGDEQEEDWTSSLGSPCLVQVQTEKDSAHRVSAFMVNGGGHEICEK